MHCYQVTGKRYQKIAEILSLSAKSNYYANIRIFPVISDTDVENVLTERPCGIKGFPFRIVMPQGKHIDKRVIGNIFTPLIYFYLSS